MQRFFSLQIACLALLAPVCLGVAQAEEWAWTTPTPGLPNAGVVAAPAERDATQEVPIAAVSVIVSEVYALGSQVEEEFVELYNYGSSPLDIGGLVLQNAAGKKAVIEGGARIDAGGFYVLKGKLPISDTADQILLKRGNEDVDTLTFERGMMKERGSISRYCDVYELRFCEVKATVPTPGAENRMERLTVRAIPANGVLRPGQPARFEANMPGAKILLSRSASGTAPESELYTGPLTVPAYATYWYYAQWEGQATVPQKILFRVDPTLPEETQFAAASTVVLSEVFVDATTGSGWVEVHQKGTKSADLEGMELDTRADQTAVCSSCLRMTSVARLDAGAYTTWMLPKATVRALLARTTPVTLTLRFAGETMDSVTVPLRAQARPRMSWQRVMLDATEEPARFAWSDIPTPGLSNVFYRLEDTLPVGEAVAPLLYVEAGYEDTRLVLLGKSVPGYTVEVKNDEGTLLGTASVSQKGVWSLTLAQRPKGDELAFALRYGNADAIPSTMRLAIPVFDAADGQTKSSRTPVTTLQPVKVPSRGATPVSSTASAPTVTTTGAPDLATMTGVVLTAVRTGYVHEGLETLALVGEPRQGNFLARVASALSLQMGAMLLSLQ